MKKKLVWAGVFLVLPVLVLGGIVVKNEADLATARSWRIGITGYDPRDLLYGHYLNFRFVWPWKEGGQKQCADKNVCVLCFEGETTTPVVSYVPFDAAPLCQSSLRLADNPHRSWENNIEGTQRYLIPEDGAPTLEKLLRGGKNKLALDVRVTKGGQRILGDLYVDDQPWRDWLAQHPETAR